MVEINNLPHNELLTLFNSKPENELVSLLEEVLVYFDTSPLDNFEKESIDSAINEYNLGQTIK